MDANIEPDQGLAIKFFVKAVEHPRETKAKGRPIFKDVEYIHIKFPADAKRDRVAKVSEVHYVSHLGKQVTYAERFQKYYDEWKTTQTDEYVDGTPISEFPALTEAKRQELRAKDIKTVEQLAALPTHAVSNLGMGGMDIVTKAQDYLKKSAGLSELDAMRARIAELEAAASDTTPAANESDEFTGMENADLQNIIKGAGKTVPKNASRAKMIDMINALAAEKEKEVA